MRKALLRGTASLAVMVGVLALLTFAWSAPARAETFTVTKTDDSGVGSLRQAITDANATSEADTVTFAPEGTGTITLASTLTVTKPLTIEGPGAQALTISGNDVVRPLYVDDVTLNLSGVTIANGRVAEPSRDAQANYGGAIFNFGGDLTIRDSVLTDNDTVDAYKGGAIYTVRGTANLIDSSVGGYRAAYGGAVYSQSLSTTTLEGSTLTGNFAELDGGAVYNTGLSQLNITAGSHLHGNGAWLGGGGGVYNSNGAVRITDSTISDNSTDNTNGDHGGGVYTTGKLVVARSTFSGNFAHLSGGGIYLASGTSEDTKVEDSTVSGNRAENSGDGIAIASGGSATVRGTIVAGNTPFGSNPGVEGNYANGGFNIIGGTAQAAGLQTDAQGNPVLADNGGPTKTVALVRGGKAIDQGNSFGAATDQRGTPRPKDYAALDNAPGGDGSDVGAFEYVDPDASAPAVSASPFPQPDEGLPNSDVTVAINATDEEGGSGVWRVSYSASGAQQVAEQNVAGNSAELVVSADGETTVTYWATDRAGNRSAPQTLTVRLDKTPPDTTITSGPPAATKERTAGFSFTSEPNATFECSLDGAAFEACPSPTSYPDLPEGRHTFKVRATDEANNKESTPASWSWKVDATTPSIGTVAPASGKTRVGRIANVKATFSEKMDEATISNSTFKLFKVDPEGGITQITNATVALSANGLRVKLDPFGASATLLRANTKYRAVVTTGVKDVAGNRLDQDPSKEGNQLKAWTFITGGN